MATKLQFTRNTAYVIFAGFNNMIIGWLWLNEVLVLKNGAEVLYIQSNQSFGTKGSKLIIRPLTQHLKNWLDLCHDSGQDVVFLVKIDARVQDL